MGERTHSAELDVVRNLDQILPGIENLVQADFEAWESREKLEGRRILGHKVSLAVYFGIEERTAGGDCIAVVFVEANERIDRVFGD